MRLCRLICLSIGLAISHAVCATDFERLIARLATAQDTARVNLLNRLGEAYLLQDAEASRRYADSAYRESLVLHYSEGEGWALINQAKSALLQHDTDATERLAREALRVFRPIHHTRGVGSSINSLGIAAYYRGEYDTARVHYRQALRLFQQLENRQEQVKCYTNLGLLGIAQGTYEKAAQCFVRALRISEENHYAEGVANNCVYLAQVYHHLQDWSQVVAYQQRALKVYQKANNLVRQAVLLMDIGSSYLAQEQPERALRYYLKAQKMEHRSGHQPNGATLLTNVGSAYEALGQYDGALSYYQRARKKLSEQANRQLMPPLLHSIAGLFHKRQQHDSALYYAQASIRVAEEMQQREWLKEGFFLLSKIHEGQQDHEQALSAYQRAKAHQDSLFDKEKTQQIAELQTHYEVDKKEERIAAQTQRIALLNQKKRTEQQLRIALIIGLLLLVLLLVFYYRRYRFKQQSARLLSQKNQEIQRKNEQIEGMNRELEKRMLRAQMDPHFIFNALNAIQHLIASNNKKLALSYLAKFSKLVRMVLENSINTQVPIADEISLLERYLELETLRFQSQFTYQIVVDEAIDVYGIEVPFLLIQPYVENALVHGLRHRMVGGHLLVAFTLTEEGLRCRVEDNGVGRAAAGRYRQATKAPSRGMSVTQQRLISLNDQTSSDTEIDIIDLYDSHRQAQGTRVDILLPQTYA